MVVAIQKGLEFIKDKLREQGYETVTYGNYPYPVDAIIYIGNNLNSNMPTFTASNTESKGTFMINASNKTIQEIDNMLKRKSYTPIF